MKKLLSIFTFALMAFMAHAATEINGIYYNLDSLTRTAEVTSNPNLYSETVTIPSTVTYDGQAYLVTKIGERAFRKCTGLTSINIPGSVTSLGKEAFIECSGLTAVTLPDGVTSIGVSAFEKCSNLTSVNIPDGVTSIENYVFYQCHNLTTVNIPDGVTSIGNMVFYQCGKLASITIPSGVTSIGAYTFDSCSALTSITIPSGVTSIGKCTFYECSSLTSVSFLGRVTSIGEQAFYQCSRLKEVHITDLAAWCEIIHSTYSNPLRYAHDLYLNGEKVVDLVIPSGVTTIGDMAFENCYGLKSVTIGYGVKNIMQCAFLNCIGLTSVTFSASVKNIGYRAFEGCTNLTSIDIPNSVTSLAGSSFNGCSSLTSATIGSGLMIISPQTFQGCSNMTSILIGKSVRDIRDKAFDRCSSLTSVTVACSIPFTRVGYAFTNSTNSTLYVPIGAKAAYQAANYWKDFKEIIEKDFIQSKDQGDMDGDGEISVIDVKFLIDILLGARDVTEQDYMLGDLDGNGELSIADLMGVVKIIVNEEPSADTPSGCPDDNHPHMIDLDLPSGTKWACCNVGASKPEAYGGYYAWGETKTKSKYTISNYQHAYKGHHPETDEWIWMYNQIGNDIAGTQYDVAHVKWGGSWQMPTIGLCKEMTDNCLIEYTTLNDVQGVRCTGHNGASIFFPAGGYYDGSSLKFKTENGYFWSSTDALAAGSAYPMVFLRSSPNLFMDSKYPGRNVRPICK